MGDFLLDFRPLPERRMAAASGFLKFCDDLRVSQIEEPEFSLLLTSADDPSLWGHFQSPDGNYFVALCGRVAFDERDWERAQQTEGEGGLACKIIFNLYQDSGPGALGSLNGNFVVFLLDRRRRTFLVVTDRCGMMLAYGNPPLTSARVLSSHPDALALATDEHQKWDLTSLAEFLMTGRLTFPHTYYQAVRGLDTGTIFHFALAGGTMEFQSKARYADVDFQGREPASADDLAAELAEAFQKAVKRRTLPVLGRTAIALSGGLDSRLILSAARDRKHVFAFHLYDEENLEFQTAKAIAAACGVELTPHRRDFDYYGQTAELGVRISGGMGCFASNHFLGVRNWLNQVGVKNLLTGCYCDYLFKGLALNTTETRFARREVLTAFDFKFYRPCYWLDSPHRDSVNERLRLLFPESQSRNLGDADWGRVERKRSFPLAYEGDLAQRVIPQRVMPWYLPIVDNDVIDVCRKIPSCLKLNGFVFKKATLIACNDAVRRVPDSNVGAPLDASPLRYAVHRYASALQNRIHDRLLPQIATRGSWPNWEYYLRHSTVISSLWLRNNNAARDFFWQIAAHDPYATPIEEYRGHNVELFLRLLTLKLWLDQRTQTGISRPVETEVSALPA